MPPVNAPDWDQLLLQSEELAARVGDVQFPHVMFSPS